MCFFVRKDTREKYNQQKRWERFCMLYSKCKKKKQLMCMKKRMETARVLEGEEKGRDVMFHLKRWTI